MTTKSVFRTAARDSLPVLAGYVVLGMGFGLLWTAAATESGGRWR